MIFIMALCINVPLLLMIYVSAGISAAFLAVIATSENPLILSNADKSNLALLPVVLLCSMVFSNTMQKGRILAEKTKALISLAGTIAHEMRNPLEQMKYAMNNIAQVLPIPSTCDLDQTITAGTINQIFSHIEHGLTSCDRGLQVIDMTLREVSNQTLDPAKLSYYSALSLTETALEEYEFESPIERDRVKLQVKSDFIFKVDETAYIYIIFNLLKNALYYFSSYPDARITITIERQKITVTDSGPGISKRVLANIFKNFATDGKPNGTGLGLAYCHRTMLAFEGSIACDSVVNKYTSFILNFPFISPVEIENYTEQIYRNTSALMKNNAVLVVDDQDIYHEVIGHLLDALACRIVAVKSGEQAIKKLNHDRFDLVLMDIKMPDKDGYTVTREIRSGEIECAKNIAIVAHTSEPASMAKIKARQAGMDGFVSKPCTKLELITALYQALKVATQRGYVQQSEEKLKGKTILITDDEAFNREYVESCTNAWGMKTLQADSGETALAILDIVLHVDFILMDMRMPILDGIETTRLIRANPDFADTIIVALTGNSDLGSQEEALEAGMNGFMTKPIDGITLKKTLIDLLVSKNQIKTTGQYAAQPIKHQETLISEEIRLNRYIPMHTEQVSFFENLPLLDHARIQETKFTLKSKFQESFQCMIKNLERRKTELKTALDNNDLEGMLEALHSMIGVSGLLGAYALHQYIKLCLYPAIRAGNYPDEKTWEETLNALIELSIQVLAYESSLQTVEI